MKLWHDDIRRPPDDTWTWARTNEDAILLLLSHWPVEECSLDHDLGLHEHDPEEAARIYGADADMLAGWDPENDGRDLVRWMIRRDRVPAKVTIHSWNPAGAERMAALLREYGREPIVRPFSRA